MHPVFCAASALRWRLLLAVLPVAFCLATPVRAAAGDAHGFRSPIDAPAAALATPGQAPMLALTTAGARLVGVGLRGLIAWSDDGGKGWTQASVPVQVDLTAVNFATPQHGWAVGHRGVVLESQDGGASWTRRFAGVQLHQSAVQHYEAQQPQAESPAARGLAQAQRAVKDGAPPSLLDVWFDSPTSGTLVGTFNTLFRTQDGGKTWQPWMDRIDNPEELHFYAVRGAADGLYLAGERGSVWRLDAAAKRWVAVPTGYAGTLFGLVVEGPRVWAFGMRGTVFASADAGKTWQAVPTPRKAGLAAGLRLSSGDIVLADQAGGLIRSRDTGRSFSAVEGHAGVLAFSLAQGVDGQVFSAGPRGVAAMPLQ